jgi:hypothetical protein
MPKEHQTTVSSGQNEFPNSQASPLISDREANTDQCSTGSRTHQDLGVANIRLAIDSTTAGAAVVAGAHEQDPENRLLTPGSFPEDLEQGKLNKMTVDDQISAVHVAQPVRSLLALTVIVLTYEANSNLRIKSLLSKFPMAFQQSLTLRQTLTYILPRPKLYPLSRRSWSAKTCHSRSQLPVLLRIMM